MTKGEFVALLAEYPDDMPIFMHDMDDAKYAGEEHAVPDPRKVRLHPRVENRRKVYKLLFDAEKDWGRDRFEHSEPDGEPFDAIVIYVGE